MPIVDKCPHCDTSHVQSTLVFHQQLDDHHPGVTWRITRCQNPNCSKLVLCVLTGAAGVIGMYPVGRFELVEDVPIGKEIRDDFREAGLSLGAGCYKASLVMSRRALQRCLKEQDCNQNKLVDAISHAISTNVLRKAFHPLAEEIRQYGNLGAHPEDDQLQNATHENAATVLEFVRLLIHEFYEVPASAGKLKAARKT